MAGAPRVLLFAVMLAATGHAKWRQLIRETGARVD